MFYAVMARWRESSHTPRLTLGWVTSMRVTADGMAKVLDRAAAALSTSSLLLKKLYQLHATGFEPAAPLRKTDYESVAFDHSAMHAGAILSPKCAICNHTNITFLLVFIGKHEETSAFVQGRFKTFKCFASNGQMMFDMVLLRDELPTFWRAFDSRECCYWGSLSW